jgi:GDPmannose 4,6-dehydratase
VKEFVIEVFGRLDLDWTEYVEIDPRYLRPAEVDELRGVSDKVRSTLGWAPKIHFQELVDRMVAKDLDLAQNEKILKESGQQVTLRGLATH